ncbi:MAG: Hpt domain-containing protein [Desulfovibrio sp.]|nr:Hpt domain-containing protein [Desulfovibrio sp.]
MSDLPSVLPGIDIATGLSRVAGNKKLYLKLLRHVATDVPATLEKLSAAVAGKDAHAVREIAHSLKGASANLSITDVAASAEHLESAAKEEDFAAIATHVTGLEEVLQRYVAIIATLGDL